MDAPGWGFAGSLHEDDGGFAMASKGLQDKEANTLMQSLTQFESAVYGEVKLPPNKKAPGKQPGKERYRGIPADGQSTRPLRVQVDEWKSAFLHLRVRGEPCPCPSQESGWQWHEPHEPPAQAGTSSSSPPKEAVPKIWRSGMKAPVAPERNPLSLRIAAKVANVAMAKRGSRMARAGQVDEKPPRGARAGSKKGGAAAAAAEAALAAAVLPPPPELRLDGASVPILPPPMAEDGHEPEEVFAQHGEFQEVYAQHTDNWAITKQDLSTRKMQEGGSRRRNQRRQAASAEREEARRRMREAEAGMPPVEPVAAAQNEAKEILFDTVWANLCPMLAPLLSGMYRPPEVEEEEEEGGFDVDGAESMFLTQEGSQVMTFDDEEPHTEVPGYSEGNAGWPPPLLQEPEARQAEPLGAREHSPAGTGFKALHCRRLSTGDVMDAEPLSAGEARNVMDPETLSADGIQMLRPSGGYLFSNSRPPSRARGSTSLSRQSSRSLESPMPSGTSSPGNVLVPSRPCSSRARTPRTSTDRRHSIDDSSTPIAMVLSREPAGRLPNLRTGGFQSPTGSGMLPYISPPQSTGNSLSGSPHHVNSLSGSPHHVNSLSGSPHHVNISHLSMGSPSTPTRRTSNSSGNSLHPPPPPHHNKHHTPPQRPMASRSKAQQPTPPTLPLLISNDKR